MAYALNTNYHFRSHSGGGAYLNVYGNDTISHNRPVCLWSYYDTKAQNWQVRADGSYLKIVSTIDTNYALNAWRGETPYVCDVYPYSGNEKDARVKLEPYDASKNLYKIRLQNYALYLTAPKSTSNNDGKVVWTSAFAANTSSETRQIWELTTEGGNLPAPSVHKRGHFVSFAGEGGCLNVYGNETIANNRDVCIWAWDDSNAQTWILGTVNGRQKIFSQLSYPKYALNVYRDSTYNCDVYPHSGNDADSTVLYELDTRTGAYRFFMPAWGVYLTAMGRSNLSKVVWRPRVTDLNDKSQLWKITTVNPNPGGGTNPDPGPGTPLEDADSGYVTTVIPAHPDRYSSRGGTKISEITIHHMAGTSSVENLGSNWQKDPTVSDGYVSSHYSIKDGTIGQFVREENRAYTNGDGSIYALPGGSASNYRAVTIEVSNSATGDTWPVSEESFNSLVKLVADIAKRNGLEKLTLGMPNFDDKMTDTSLPAGNLTWHRMYSYIICPGDYLLSRMQELCDKANALNGY